MSIYIAHLLRNLNWLNNLDKKQKWSSRLQELLRKAVHWRNEKKLILHIYALMLALFALGWENNRQNCEEMEVNGLKLLIIFLLRIYLLSKSSAKTAFRADTLWEMGQRCSIKGSVSQERTSDATRCNWRYNTLHLLARTRSISPYNTLQCEIQCDVCPF